MRVRESSMASLRRIRSRVAASGTFRSAMRGRTSKTPASASTDLLSQPLAIFLLYLGTERSDTFQKPPHTLLKNGRMRKQTHDQKGLRVEIEEIPRLREHVPAVEQFDRPLLFGTQSRDLQCEIPTALQRKR